MNIDIDTLTLAQARKLARMFPDCGVSFAEVERPVQASDRDVIQSAFGGYANLIGKPVMIRTVTMIYIGELVEIYPQELVIETASWIPETGRWHQFITQGLINECEPYGKSPVTINRSAVLDVVVWEHPLPTEQK